MVDLVDVICFRLELNLPLGRDVNLLSSFALRYFVGTLFRSCCVGLGNLRMGWPPMFSSKSDLS